MGSSRSCCGKHKPPNSAAAHIQHLFLPPITYPEQVGGGILLFTGSLMLTEDLSAYHVVKNSSQCKRQNIKTWECRVMSLDSQVGRVLKKKRAVYRTGHFLLQGSVRALHMGAHKNTAPNCKNKNEEIHLGSIINCVVPKFRCLRSNSKYLRM